MALSRSSSRRSSSCSALAASTAFMPWRNKAFMSWAAAGRAHSRIRAAARLRMETPERRGAAAGLYVIRRNKKPRRRLYADAGPRYAAAISRTGGVGGSPVRLFGAHGAITDRSRRHRHGFRAPAPASACRRRSDPRRPDRRGWRHAFEVPTARLRGRGRSPAWPMSAVPPVSAPASAGRAPSIAPGRPWGARLRPRRQGPKRRSRFGAGGPAVSPVLPAGVAPSSRSDGAATVFRRQVGLG